MRINPPPGLKFEYNGSVLLEYFGTNFDLKNCLTYKNALFYFRDNMSNSSIINILFEVVFFQFQSEKLKLNFINSEVLIERDNDFLIIGQFILDKICIEDSCVIISGNYQHNTINLAWHNEDLVKFNFIINIDKRIDMFLKNFKRFIAKYPDIKEKVFFFNT